MMSVDNTCRLCGQTISHDVLFSLTEDQNFLQIVQKHLFIQIDPSDHLSHSVCSGCKDTVMNWHSFWSRCHEIQKSLDSVIPAPSLSFVDLTPKEKSLSVPATDDEDSLASNNDKPSKSRSCYCVAKWCNNNNTTGSMFRIPKDKTRGDQWLINSGRKDLLDLDVKKRVRLYLCSKHFTDSMFSNRKKVKLNRNAIPSIFPQHRSDNRRSSIHQELSQENSDFILQQEMNAVAVVDGKLRRILPKNEGANKFESNSIAGNMFVEDCVLNHSVEVNRNQIPCPSNKTVNLSKDSPPPPVLRKVTLQNKQNCQTVTSSSLKKRATNSTSQKAKSEFIPPGQDEDSTMTCDDSYFPASSLLDFQESMHRCTFCGEVFAIKNSLSNHLKTYHL